MSLGKLVSFVFPRVDVSRDEVYFIFYLKKQNIELSNIDCATHPLNNWDQV